MLAIDYRGFGDSTGQPDEPGVELDAHTAFQWLIENGAKPQDILIVGHSLGTSIASKLAKRLTGDKIRPRGLALLAPFTSLTVVIESYPLFGLPILQPLQTFAGGRSTRLSHAYKYLILTVYPYRTYEMAHPRRV